MPGTVTAMLADSPKPHHTGQNPVTRHTLAPGLYNPPTRPWLDIIFEDAHILVLNKPHGLLSVPGKGAHLADCVAARAISHTPTATIVHRLDMETSGLMVVAKTPEAHRHISKQFERRHVKKRYRATVWGHMTRDSGRVDLPLRCDWPNRPKQMVDFTLGKPAHTNWHATERTTLPMGTPITHVALSPQTGRSHQLRLHMLALGHPILGDNLYGTPASKAAAPCLMLHADYLAFHHPKDGKIHQFTK